MSQRDAVRREVGSLANKWSVPAQCGVTDPQRYPDDAAIFAVRSPIELARDVGVRFTGRVNGDWHECHAVDRPDARPSAAVHAGTGFYKDLGGGEDRRFWDVLAELGGSADWREARDVTAREAGLLAPDDRRTDPRRPAPSRPRPEKNEPARSPRDEKPTPVYPTAEAAADDLRRLFNSPGMRAKGNRFVPDDGLPTLHRYRNGDGREVGAVSRIDGTKADGSRSKRIRPLPCDTDGWRRGAMAEPRPLYRLPELLAEPDAIVLAVEGEKAADRIAGEIVGGCRRCRIDPDLVVTTWAGGAKAHSRTDWTPLAGRRVLVWADHDDEGRKARGAITRTLAALDRPARVKWIDPLRLWPDMPEKGDAADWLDHDDATEPHTLAESIVAARVRPQLSVEGGA